MSRQATKMLEKWRMKHINTCIESECSHFLNTSGKSQMCGNSLQSLVT